MYFLSIAAATVAYQLHKIKMHAPNMALDLISAVLIIIDLSQ
jgi:hypothetical protein